MNIRQGYEEKSRLGRLLLNRGYLSEEQLSEGLRRQRETGQKLGEVLVASGWITERDLNRALRHQAHYRNAAALMTMVALPFQPLVSFAATPAEASANTAHAGQMMAGGGLAALTDEEMAGVAAQSSAGLLERIAAVSDKTAAATTDDPLNPTTIDAVEGLRLAANLFVPVLNFLDSELTVSGVYYRDGQPRFSLRDDGALTLALPERIEEIRMANIRVSGGLTPAMGDISLRDIQFDPASRMTLFTR